MVKTLRDLFLDAARAASDAPFLADADQQLSYAEALDRACRRARFLVTARVQLGERVLLVDEDPMQTALWAMACSLIGAAFAVLHRDTSRARMRYLLDDADPAGVVDLGDTRREVYSSRPQLRFVVAGGDAVDALSPWRDFDRVDILETDLAFLVYTSGSTGRPRGILSPHRSVLAAATSINTFIAHTAQDRIAHLLPLSFDYGLYQLFLAMQARACVIFFGGFRSALDLTARLRAFKITGLPAMRSTLVPLSRLGAEECRTEHLRYISSTGDSLPTLLIQKITANFPGVQFFSMYGLSECKRALYMPPDRLQSKPQSVGRPIPGSRAFVVDPNGQVLPPGAIGELTIEGPHVMNGYWNAPEETAATFVHGPYGQPWLRTGDLFLQDSEGDFHFVARKDDLIKSRGVRISPREVETALLAADPGVRECIVYGVEDELLGQAVCANVTVDDPSHTVAEIFARCRAEMDAYLVPTHIHIVETLPKTSSGKYARRLVRET